MTKVTPTHDIPDFLLVKNRRPLTIEQWARLEEVRAVAAKVSETGNGRSFKERAEEDRLKKLEAFRVRTEKARDKKRVPDRVAADLSARLNEDTISKRRYERVMRELPTASMKKILADTWFLGEDGRYHSTIFRGVVRRQVRSGRAKSKAPEETEMAAKKKAAKKTNGEARIRDVERPAGLVEDFRPVREGSARAVVLRMGMKGATVDAIAKELKKPRQTVLTHLHCMNRDCGTGYKTENDKVTIKLPGSKTIKDAIKEAVEAA